MDKSSIPTPDAAPEPQSEDVVEQPEGELQDGGHTFYPPVVDVVDANAHVEAPAVEVDAEVEA